MKKYKNYLKFQIFVTRLVLFLPCVSWANTYTNAFEGCVAQLLGAKQIKFLFDEFLQTLFEQKLSELPTLKPIIMESMNRQQVPAGLKNMWIRTIPRTTIRRFSAELREELHLHPRTGFFAVRFNPTFSIFNSNPEFVSVLEREEAANEDRWSTLNAKSRTQMLAVVPDKDPILNVSSLLLFIHAMARLDFDTFLEKNIANLARKFPNFILLLKNGTYAISDQFYLFIAERYADEVEYLSISSLQTRMTLFPRKKWGKFYHGVDAHLSEIIPKKIINDYELTDPDVLALASKSLDAILKTSGP